jgi:hypothetical protein
VIHAVDDLTSLLAIYAAVISTIALGWNISRDLFNARRSVRLLFSRDNAIFVGGKAVGVSLHLRITNGSPNRQIEIVALHLEGDLVWLTPEHDGGVRPATVEDPLPIMLTPSQSVLVPFYLVPSVFARFGNLQSITIEDSTGRKYKLGPSQLRTVQSEVRSIAASRLEPPNPS